MKILQIVDERWDSGIVDYALNLSRGLVKKGHQVTVAALAEKSPITQARSMGLPVFELKGSLCWYSLYRYVRKEKFDIIDAHTGSSHTWAVLFLNVPSRIIRTRCDVRTPAKNFFMNVIMSRTHRLIVPAQFILKAYKDIYPGFPERKITLIPGGIDPDEFTCSPEPPAADGIRIGIVGRLDPVKGHRFLIEAFASVRTKFNNVKLIVAGKEENISIGSLRSHAESFGLNKEIEFTGFVDSVKDIMRSCHIGVIASISSEAISRAALEWMASGRAVVATTVGGMPDLIAHDLTGLLVEPARPLELASALKRFIAEPDLRNRIARYARKSIETTYSLKNFIMNTEVVFEDAIEHPAC